MAVVKIYYIKNLESAAKYVKKDRGSQDLVDGEGTSPETVVKDFEATIKNWNPNGKNKAVHIIQSWDEKESKQLPAEKFKEMGMELVRRYFPDHEFLINTHTETGKTHNHILVNIVNPVTGKKIENKKHHLYRLRDLSDKICLENGLSIINQKGKEREARLPDVAKRIQRFHGKSYLWDLMQKADFAKTYSTGYDEYVSILSELGIKARVEDKNITYFYPGVEKGKRGSKLGRKYDKKGLEEGFRKNDEIFLAKPELKQELRSQLRSLMAGEAPAAKGPTGNKNYGDFTKQNRRGYTPDIDLSQSHIPIEEIRKARNTSILDYCKRNRILLDTNEKGDTVLKGREFVKIIDEYHWQNTKNKTVGSLIEFVANHNRVSYFEAIAHINNNPRLRLLEQHFGKEKQIYSSFYVPKAQSAGLPEALSKLGKLLKAMGSNPSTAQTLLRHDQAQVLKSGTIRLFPQEERTGALEFTEQKDGSWARKRQGNIEKPFVVARGNGPRAVVFTDPLTLMAKQGHETFAARNRQDGILGLMEPNHQVVDRFIAQNPHVKELQIVPAGKKLSKVELDFFENLKSRYRGFGVEVEEVSFTKALTREGPELSL